MMIKQELKKRYEVGDIIVGAEYWLDLHGLEGWAVEICDPEYSLDYVMLGVWKIEQFYELIDLLERAKGVKRKKIEP